MHYINRGRVTPDMTEQGRTVNGWHMGDTPTEFVYYREGLVASRVEIIDGWWRATGDEVRYSAAAAAMASAQLRFLQSA